MSSDLRFVILKSAKKYLNLSIQFCDTVDFRVNPLMHNVVVVIYTVNQAQNIIIRHVNLRHSLLLFY